MSNLQINCSSKESKTQDSDLEKADLQAVILSDFIFEVAISAIFFSTAAFVASRLGSSRLLCGYAVSCGVHGAAYFLETLATIRAAWIYRPATQREYKDKKSQCKNISTTWKVIAVALSVIFIPCMLVCDLGIRDAQYESVATLAVLGFLLNIMSIFIGPLQGTQKADIILGTRVYV